MQSKVRLFGHAVHPMLVDFPIVIFTLLAILDVAEGMNLLDTGGVGLFLCGIGGGITILAIVTGAIDFFFLPKQTRAHKLALWHFGVGIAVWAMFGAASWGHTSASMGARTAVDVGGMVLVFVQGYLGGELMERHHVGIKSTAEGADPVTLARTKKA